MKKILSKKIVISLLSVLCVCALVLALVLDNAPTTKALEYNEENPDFKFELINGEAEKIVSNKDLYDCKGTFSGKNGVYKISTDAYTAWQHSDDIAFAYRQYDIGGTKDDKLTVETRIDSRTFSGTEYPTASTGLMLRQSLDPGSPHVFLHCRDTIAIVYRSQQGGSTTVKYAGVSPIYPVSLKIEKVGTQYTCYYKNANMKNYVKIAVCGSNIQGPVLGGFAAHACLGPNEYVNAQFTGYKAVGSGTYNPEGSGEDDTTSSEPENVWPEWEDAPVADDVLLSETFTDGSMINDNGKEQNDITNPIWRSSSGDITLDEDNNRVLTKNFVTSTDYVGNFEWTDYSASVDVRFTENCDPEQTNQFTLFVRHYEVGYLGMYDYGVTLYGGNEVRIYRRYRSKEGYANGNVVAKADCNYLDKPGEWQNLYVEAVDDRIRVSVNGVELINYQDKTTTKAITKGQIGISTYDTDCAIDNVIVRKIYDELGGDYDNDIGGNYNEKVPDYIKNWSDKNRPY